MKKVAIGQGSIPRSDSSRLTSESSLRNPKVQENLSNMTKAQYNKAMKVYEEASGIVYEILTTILCSQPAVQTTATASNPRIIEDLKPIKMLLASMLLESFKH